jgi:hypothetical protein
VREIPAPLHTSACTTPDLRELARDAPYPVHVNTTGLRVQWSSMAVLSSASPCAEATGNLQRMSDLAAALRRTSGSWRGVHLADCSSDRHEGQPARRQQPHHRPP